MKKGQHQSIEILKVLTLVIEIFEILAISWRLFEYIWVGNIKVCNKIKGV